MKLRIFDVIVFPPEHLDTRLGSLYTEESQLRRFCVSVLKWLGLAQPAEHSHLPCLDDKQNFCITHQQYVGSLVIPMLWPIIYQEADGVRQWCWAVCLISRSETAEGLASGLPVPHSPVLLLVFYNSTEYFPSIATVISIHSHGHLCP